MRITVIAGTNREGSRTLRVARAVVRRHEALGAEVTLLDLRDMPAAAFTPTAYQGRPAVIQPMADAVTGADGLVVVTPEYNGGFPGVLKLFIDLLPFPVAFEHRPVCFVGVSDGRWGALRPIEQLTQIWGYRNGFVFPDRVFLAGATTSVGDDGEPTDSGDGERLDRQAAAYQDFVARLRG